MSEPNKEGIQPAQGTFGVRHRFPGEGQVPEPAPAPSVAQGKSKVFTRVVLPVVLLILIVGGIAWVTQNMSAWRGPKEDPRPSVQTKEIMVRFVGFQPTESQTFALWDPTDPEYAYEVERSLSEKKPT